MDRYRVIEKKIGETPLQAIEAFRGLHSELKDMPLTYAGRLDPMAQGKLVVLIGEECKKRDSYTKLDKEYEFEVLFGISTDTGDVLGLAESSGESEIKKSEIKRITALFKGNYSIPYPKFSSKAVGGKQLFAHALSGSIDEIEIPSISVEIYKMRYLGSRIVGSAKIRGEILQKIDLLHVEAEDKRLGSGFRKEEISARWGDSQVLKSEYYTIAKFRTVVSSGTYIRSLVSLIAEKLGTKGLAYSINRTKIGHYHPLTGSIGFWTGNL